MATRPTVEELLVLKAYYLGRAAAGTPVRKAVALEMTDKAILYLGAQSDRQSQVRLLFYQLLKAEINRGDSDALTSRAHAQRTARALGSDMFEQYMSVEGATQSVTKAHGPGQGVVANSGVESRKLGGSGLSVGVYDVACRALGLDEGALTEAHWRFLNRTTLRDLLVKHGIEHK